MPRLPRLNAEEAESFLLANGYTMIRSKGAHRIYVKNTHRIVIPFHGNKVLHPKILKQIYSVANHT
ncbi:MAG: type II toxin-antitoxin system HicA family toxin [Nitrospirae bacterium]|nr:type II toxin-antitoxin system HicA family toxin [Nitrospirota bacterium]MBF0591541.1 type II toxin-antitoxin system HicA family toxin [Nitrospirota bacterium]